MRRTLLAALVAVPVAAHAAGDTEIHLSETATRTMQPDRLRATLRVEVKGATPRAVQAELNAHMEGALEKAKSVAAVKSSTGTYQVYRTSVPGQRQEWQANESLVISSSDSTAVLTLAGSLQEDGLALSGLEFYLAPETLKGTEAALTASALAALKVRAEAVAKDLGMRIDHYRTIAVGNAAANAGPIRPMPMLAAAGAAQPPPVAEAADATVTLTVTADIVLASQ